MSRLSLLGFAALALVVLPAGCEINSAPPAPDHATSDRAAADRTASDARREGSTGDHSTAERSGHDLGLPDQATVDAPPFGCPASVPGGSCSPQSFPHTCWYGADARWFCRTSAVCDTTTGTWSVTPPVTDCQGAQPTGCPTTRSTPYTDCATTPLTCLYTDAYCHCGFTGGPEPGWTCTTIPQGCPALPPDEGDPCTGATSCLYYPCSKRADCQKNSWHWTTLEC